MAVERIFDAAESVIAEVGFERASTHLIASRAGMSVGSMYRWFPDKFTIAEHLTRRYAERLAVLADSAFSAAGDDEPTPDLTRRVFRALATGWREMPAIGSLMCSALGPHARESPGRELHLHLTELARLVVLQRVPGISGSEASLSASVCVSILEAALLELPMRSGEWPDWVDEAAYAVAAYLAIKYPLESSHRWRDPLPGLKPSATSTR